MGDGENGTVPFIQALQKVIESLTTAGFGGHAPWASTEMNFIVLGMNVTGVLLTFLALPVFAIPMVRQALDPLLLGEAPGRDRGRHRPRDNGAGGGGRQRPDRADARGRRGLRRDRPRRPRRVDRWEVHRLARPKHDHRGEHRPAGRRTRRGVRVGGRPTDSDPRRSLLACGRLWLRRHRSSRHRDPKGEGRGGGGDRRQGPRWRRRGRERHRSRDACGGRYRGRPHRRPDAGRGRSDDLRDAHREASRPRRRGRRPCRLGERLEAVQRRRGLRALAADGNRRDPRVDPGRRDGVLAPQTEFVRTEAPAIAGRSLAEVDLRSKTGCTVVAVERDGELVTDIDAEFVVRDGDVLVVTGSEEATERFVEFVR